MSTHGKDGYLSIDGNNISPYLNSISPTRSNDIHDDTTFGQDGHTKKGGLTDGSIAIAGLWDKTADVGPYQAFKAMLGAFAPLPFEYGAEGNGSGKVKVSGNCVLENYVESIPVADLVSFTASVQISGTVTDGTFSP